MAGWMCLVFLCSARPVQKHTRVAQNKQRQNGVQQGYLTSTGSYQCKGACCCASKQAWQHCAALLHCCCMEGMAGCTAGARRRMDCCCALVRGLFCICSFWLRTAGSCITACHPDASRGCRMPCAALARVQRIKAHWSKRAQAASPCQRGVLWCTALPAPAPCIDDAGANP